MEALAYKKKNRKWLCVFLRVYLGVAILIGNVLVVYAKPVPYNQTSTETSEDNKEEIEEIKENALYAQSAVLMDAETGRVLYGKNEDAVLPMASTTKIMTLLVALEEGDLSKVVTVSSYAASMPDVQLNMREGEQYYLKDLLYSLMLESHNDSAVAIAECVAGSIEAFAQKMNQKAKEIGCENTTFITPNGLDATAIMTGRDGMEKEITHSTTAKDLAKIMSYCVTGFSKKEQFLEITRTQEYTFSDCSGRRTFSCRNHNAFLHMMEGALSGKTGFTGKAGYCYVGALQKDGRTFVVSLLACGWPNNKTYKWKDTMKLMEYGIDNYEYCLYEDAAKDIPKEGEIQVLDGQTKGIGEVAYVEWKAQNATENLLAGSEPSLNQKMQANTEEGMLLRKDEKIDLEWNISENMQAPVKAGDIAGYIRYLVNGEVYKEEVLVLQSSVDLIDYDWCLEKMMECFLLF